MGERVVRKTLEDTFSSTFDIEPTQAFKSKWPVVGLVAGAVGLVAFLIYIFAPREFEAKVVGLKWVHTSTYQERSTKHGSGWGMPVFASVFNVRCESRYYGEENCHPYKCRPHQVSVKCNPYTCNCSTSCVSNRNGSRDCSRSCSTCYRTCPRTEYDTCYERCPVHKNWCEYDYHQWENRGSRTLTGDRNNDLAWADLGPVDEVHRMQKTAAYIVHFALDAERFSWDPETEAEFRMFDIDQTWQCQAALVGLFKPLRRQK